MGITSGDARFRHAPASRMQYANGKESVQELYFRTLSALVAGILSVVKIHEAGSTEREITDSYGLFFDDALFTFWLGGTIQVVEILETH
ncbi:hypothetical protein FQN49_006279 [Arthroderma sp. PD_2]|nr:hypothetical protein FQN49_006279 [Arthroderma sp. PD_2]